MTSAVLVLALGLSGQSPQGVYPAAQGPGKVLPAAQAPGKVSPAPQAPAKVSPAPQAPSKVAPAPHAPSKVSPTAQAPSKIARASGSQQNAPRRRLAGPAGPEQDCSGAHAPGKVSPAPQAPSKIAPAPYAPGKVSPAPQAPSKIAPAPYAPAKVCAGAAGPGQDRSGSLCSWQGFAARRLRQVLRHLCSGKARCRRLQAPRQGFARSPGSGQGLAGSPGSGQGCARSPGSGQGSPAPQAPARSHRQGRALWPVQRSAGTDQGLRAVLITSAIRRLDSRRTLRTTESQYASLETDRPSGGSLLPETCRRGRFERATTPRTIGQPGSEPGAALAFASCRYWITCTSCTTIKPAPTISSRMRQHLRDPFVPIDHLDSFGHVVRQAQANERGGSTSSCRTPCCRASWSRPPIPGPGSAR